MDKAHLKALLNELHAELSQAENLDESSASLLRELQSDIETVLEDRDAGGESQSLTDRLSEAVDRFEESHPSLTVQLARVAEALARIAH